MPFGRSAWVRIQNHSVRLRCVYFTKSEPVSKIGVNESGDVMVNSATAQRPLHHTVEYDSVSPFPLFRVRPRLAPCAHAESVLRGFGFSFFGMGEGEIKKLELLSIINK